MEPPTVLLGLATRNRARELAVALESALGQDFSRLAVRVLDDGSTDDTPAVEKKFPQVAWSRNAKPLGLIEARNRLMRETDAEFYVSLDDDAWFLEGDEISVAVAHLVAHPEVVAVAFDILSPDRPEPVARGAAMASSLYVGCGHVLRLAAVREAGFYAPSLGPYGSEEKDLSLRLADAGGRIDFLPGVHVWHDKAWSERDWDGVHTSGVCNELVMTLRRCPAPDVFAVLPLKLVSYLRFWWREPRYWRPGLRGVTWALRHLGTAWHSRAPVKRATFWRLSRFGRS